FAIRRCGYERSVGGGRDQSPAHDGIGDASRSCNPRRYRTGAPGADDDRGGVAWNGARGARFGNRVRRAAAAGYGGGRRVAFDPVSDLARAAEHVLRCGTSKEEYVMMPAPQKALLIFMDETDRWKDDKLYEAIVRVLEKQGMAGATVVAGLMGY